MTPQSNNPSLTSLYPVDIINPVVETTPRFDHACIQMRFPFVFEYKGARYRGICEIEKDCGSGQLYATNIEWHEKPDFQDSKLEFDILESSEPYFAFDINWTIDMFVEQEICYTLDPKNNFRIDLSKEVPDWSNLKVWIESEEYALTNWTVTMPFRVEISDRRYHAVIVIYYDILEDDPGVKYMVVPNGLDKDKEIRMSHSLDKLALPAARKLMNELTGINFDIPMEKKPDGRVTGRALLDFIKSGQKKFSRPEPPRKLPERVNPNEPPF